MQHGRLGGLGAFVLPTLIIACQAADCLGGESRKQQLSSTWTY